MYVIVMNLLIYFIKNDEIDAHDERFLACRLDSLLTSLSTVTSEFLNHPTQENRKSSPGQFSSRFYFYFRNSGIF